MKPVSLVKVAASIPLVIVGLLAAQWGGYRVYYFDRLPVVAIVFATLVVAIGVGCIGLAIWLVATVVRAKQ